MFSKTERRLRSFSGIFVKVTYSFARSPAFLCIFFDATREQAKFTLRILANPRLESLVNLCYGPFEGKKRRSPRPCHPPRRFLLERDGPVDKTIAGGIIGIIYAGFAVGYTTRQQQQQRGMFEGGGGGRKGGHFVCVTTESGSPRKIPPWL